MNSYKKKTAPRAATPETENTKIMSINSILKKRQGCQGGNQKTGRDSADHRRL